MSSVPLTAIHPLERSNKYSGMALPWGNTLSSYFEPKNDHDILRTSIEMILFTMPGERVMLNDFGSELWHQVFELQDEQVLNALADIVKENVTRWDPRLDVLNLVIVPDSEHQVIQVYVEYVDKGNGITTSTEIQMTFMLPGVNT